MDTNQHQEQLLINGQYLTIKEIGRGGFGIVWKAYDFSLKNFVAVKKLLDCSTEPKFIEMFYKEALVAKNLINDNIVRVQHFWQGSDGGYYLLLDYVKGCDLEHLLKKCRELNTKLPWEMAVYICGEILKALDYANRVARDPLTEKPYGLVYRDLSPGNVMIAFNGTIKLSDFGIATVEGTISRETQQRTITGKYGYMSPEQTRGDIDIDHMSDIFSCGVLLYEMLSNSQLFFGDTDAIKHQVSQAKFDPEPLRAIGISNELVEIITKALEKDKQNRYQNAHEMLGDLIKILRGKGAIHELMLEMSNFVSCVLSDELSKKQEHIELVRHLDFQHVVNDPNVNKITCRDFIPGGTESVAVVPHAIEAGAGVKIKHDEAKGKTVFEEVGDWLTIKFKLYRKMFIQIFSGLLIAAVLFALVDIFIPGNITPTGRKIFFWVYPPSAIIYTVPMGAVVTMKSRDDKVILSEVTTNERNPTIELRKVSPGSYNVTAVKEGFNPIMQTIKIEGRLSSAKGIQEIKIVLGVTVKIDSDPSGAEVKIDGNKVGITQWSGELLAGKHTVELSYNGFEKLGSTAKETKDGQCNLDFSERGKTKILAGVDQKYWEYWDCDIDNTKGTKTLGLKGYLFKNFSVDSSPSNTLIFVDNKNKPIGITPCVISLNAGLRSIRFSKPNRGYQETTRAIKVDETSPSNIFVALNKLITFVACESEHPETILSVAVKVKGHNINISKKTSVETPLVIALPVNNKYNVSFSSGNEYEPLELKDVDITKTNVITGKLEFQNPLLNVTVKDKMTNAPITGAYIWVNNNLGGRTDNLGTWEDRVPSNSTSTIKIISKGYVSKLVEKELSRGQKVVLDIALLLDKPIVCPKCGKRYPADSDKVFCTRCGARITK